MPTLSATLSERGEELTTGAGPPDVDPIPSVLPPEGITAATLAEVARELSTAASPRMDVAGARGCAGAAVVSAIVRTAGRRVVLVTSDLESARKLADDVAFWVRGAEDEDTAEDTGQGTVLVFAASESSPYADVNPDRRAGMSRMATLSHLASSLAWSVLIVPAAALVRKVVPRAVVRARTERIVAEDELDREGLVARLVEAGYLRVPVVEDPGSFAVRGALLDVWSPSAALPVRVELYGDLVLTIKPFDPHEQRTLKSNDKDVTLAEAWLPPAREAILSRDAMLLARDRVRQLADMIDMPTTRARALVEDVVTGRAFFGAEGFLPAYYKDLEPLLSYVDDAAVVVLDDPPSVTASVQAELDRAHEDAAAKRASPHFLPGTFYVEAEAVAQSLQARKVVVLHRTPIVGEETAAETDEAPNPLTTYEVAAATGVLDLAAHDHADLSRAVKAARASFGKTATLAPLARRMAFWRDHGLRVFIAARAQTQAERLTALIRHQGVDCKARLAPFDPAWLDDASADAQVVVGPLSKGVMLPAEGLVLVTEEEIFGARVHRRKKRDAETAARPFLEDLRSLDVGDFVIHVEHGIGRYHGLVHKEVGGLTVDLLAVEYAGGDKLYLPSIG
jgi:transcription-repair coupling factor (superfamily II helicase)